METLNLFWGGIVVGAGIWMALIAIVLAVCFFIALMDAACNFFQKRKELR